MNYINLLANKVTKIDPLKFGLYSYILVNSGTRGAGFRKGASATLFLQRNGCKWQPRKARIRVVWMGRSTDTVENASAKAWRQRLEFAAIHPPGPPSRAYIFMVPLGPKLVLRTSCRPRAALIFTASAACARATSALGFRVFTAAMAGLAQGEAENNVLYAGLLEKSYAPGPPPACPQNPSIGLRRSCCPLIGLARRWSL